MGWLIGFVVIALVVSPILWMMPTPVQKRQAGMRERARQQGLLVNIVDLPQSHRQKVRKEEPLQGVSYCRPRPRDRRRPQGEWILWRTEPEGEPTTELPVSIQSKIGELRERMPADAVAIASTPVGYALYWRELGGIEQVDRIAQLLSDVVELDGGVGG